MAASEIARLTPRRGWGRLLALAAGARWWGRKLERAGCARHDRDVDDRLAPAHPGGVFPPPPPRPGAAGRRPPGRATRHRQGSALADVVDVGRFPVASSVRVD